MFGTYLRFPTKAALLSSPELDWTDTDNYCEEVVSPLSSACSLAVKSIKNSQKKYKDHFDQKAQQKDYRISDKVLVLFPQEEQGKMCKLSEPWLGMGHTE